MRTTISSFISGASLFLMMLTSITANAQNFEGRQARAALTIGPSITTGASMTLSAPYGFKINPVFAWRGGIHTTYPLTDVISAGLEIGADSRGTTVLAADNELSFTTTRVTYFSLHPNIVFSGFNLGFNFGFPLSANATHHTTALTTQPQEFLDGVSQDISDTIPVPVLLEGRLGAVIPVYDGELGWASIVFGVGYAFNELIDQPDQVGIFGNWKNASAHLGGRFEFAIPGTERN